jgi:hypothetical protein
MFPEAAVISSPDPISSTLAEAVQAHRNQTFDPRVVQTDFEHLMRQYALITTFKDFSISDRDIDDLAAAQNNALNYINERFHRLIVMAQERQQNLLRFEGVNVISLGLDCLSRTICTHWGLKKTRRLGELSGPFDLSVHPQLTIEMLIKNDFSNYLDPRYLIFSEEHNFCINTLLKVHFNHETGREFADDNFSRLRSVYSARINNIKAGLRNPRPLCLAVHVPHFTELTLGGLVSMQQLMEYIQSLRAGAPATMAIINSFDPNSAVCVEEFCNDSIRLWNVPLPYPNYVWHDPICFLSEEGFTWERGIAERIKERMLALLP